MALKVEQNYSSSAEATVMPLHLFLQTCSVSATLTGSFPSAIPWTPRASGGASEKQNTCGNGTERSHYL